MSINSITSNPIILDELKTAIGGGGGGGSGMSVLYSKSQQAPNVSSSTIQLFNTGLIANVKTKVMVISGMVEFFCPNSSGYFPLTINVDENSANIAILTGTITGGYGHEIIPLNLTVVPTVANASYTISIKSTQPLSQSTTNPLTGNVDPCFQTITIMQ